jgi:hypothetical protein
MSWRTTGCEYPNKDSDFDSQDDNTPSAAPRSSNLENIEANFRAGPTKSIKESLSDIFSAYKNLETVRRNEIPKSA